MAAAASGAGPAGAAVASSSSSSGAGTHSQEIYRRTPVGVSLQDAVEDLLEAQHIPQELADKILQQFDHSFANEISRLKTKGTFEAECDTFNNLQGLWTIRLKNMRLKLEEETALLPDVQIFASKAAPEK